MLSIYFKHYTYTDLFNLKPLLFEADMDEETETQRVE